MFLKVKHIPAIYFSPAAAKYLTKGNESKSHIQTYTKILRAALFVTAKHREQSKGLLTGEMEKQIAVCPDRGLLLSRYTHYAMGALQNSLQNDCLIKEARPERVHTV